jgi:hypothetical protein
MQTAGIKELVSEVLESLPEPHTEDVIDDAFQAVEANPKWLATYDMLVDRHGKQTVNSFFGWWVGRYEERATKDIVTAKSKLADNYSKLGGPAKKMGKKLKAQGALDVLAAYYQTNRDSMPASVRGSRELIQELIMEGLPVEEAFSQAITKGRNS